MDKKTSFKKKTNLKTSRLWVLTCSEGRVGREGALLGNLGGQ